MSALTEQQEVDLALAGLSLLAPALGNDRVVAAVSAALPVLETKVVPIEEAVIKVIAAISAKLGADVLKGLVDQAVVVQANVAADVIEDERFPKS